MKPTSRTAPPESPQTESSAQEPPFRLHFPSGKAAFWQGMVNAFGTPALILYTAQTGFGSLAQDSGLSLWVTTLAPGIIWALPGQVVFVEMFGLGASAFTIAVAVAVANARFLPMTLSLMPLFHGATRNRKWNYALAHLISINTWVDLMKRGPEIPPEQRAPYFVGFALTCMVAGTVGAWQGYVLAGVLPPIVTLGLVFMVPIYFGLIMSNTPQFSTLFAFAVGCALGPPLHLLLPEWGMVVTGLLAGTFAFGISLKFPRKPKG
ncbi:MAG: AzlC family ABC transporter permease [SAR324 cluster bacterium]|nr:AzlC family ABC transporter permease [SAR324 cluster bacterium]